jgi:hypothetical protein
LTPDQYNILTPRLCGLMVRRWRLIGHFPILYNLTPPRRKGRSGRDRNGDDAERGGGGR